MISEHASPLSTLGTVDSGGQNLYVAQLARDLAALGYKVDVFTRRDSERFPEVLEWMMGIRVINVPAGPPAFCRKEELHPYMDDFTRYMLRFCKWQKEAYDIVHAHFWMSGLVALELKKQLRIPFVITFHALGRVRRLHQGDRDDFPAVRFEIEDQLVREADRIIAECPQDEADLVQLYNADPNRITMIPCGFDPRELFPMSKPLARMMLGFAPDERVILQVGRMVPRKGVDTVIRGLGILKRNYRMNVRLLVVGGESDEPDPTLTPEIGRLQQIALEEGVTERVTFIGKRPREHLKYYYNAADVFVTTPWYEPFGFTPVEAMACGTPVVGSNVGGIKFTVRDGETGFLVPARDPDRLAERLAYVFCQPKLMKILSRQAVRRATDIFRCDRMASAMADLYEEILAPINLKLSGSIDQMSLVDRQFSAAVESLLESRRQLRAAIVRAAILVADRLGEGARLFIGAGQGSESAAKNLALTVAPLLDEREADAVVMLNDKTVISARPVRGSSGASLAKQLSAKARPGDVLFLVSPYPSDKSLACVLEAARRIDLETIVLLGSDVVELQQLASMALIVPAASSRHVQQIQMLVTDILGEIVRQNLEMARMPVKFATSEGA